MRNVMERQQWDNVSATGLSGARLQAERESSHSGAFFLILAAILIVAANVFAFTSLTSGEPTQAQASQQR
jgi:hypothetical protein